MTLPLFQACIGPSAGKCHIHIIGELLTLCTMTSAARSVTGKINHEKLCLRCITAMAEKLKQHKFEGDVVPKCDTPDGLAQAVGLEKIT
jgi:hypothetical protein